MKKTAFTMLAYVFLAGAAMGQGIIKWQKTIGGNGTDILQSVWQTTDSGYVAGGHSYSGVSGHKTEDTLGGFDYWIVRTDSNGTVLWDNTIGGNKNEYMQSMRQTSDGGFILGGYSESDSSFDKSENAMGAFDYWVVKLSAAGVVQWENTLGGDSIDELYSIIQTADGGYLLGGSSNSTMSGDKTDSSYGEFDFWVVKLDTAGTILWQKTIGGSGYDWLRSVQQTSDGGYILGGYSDSDSSGNKTENTQGLHDYWVVKIDTAGTVEWENTIGGGDFDLLYEIRQSSDGGYILGGNSASSISSDKSENVIGFDDYWIVKLDTAGIVEWENTIGGFNNDRVRSLAEDPDGGYLIAGYSNSDIGADKNEDSRGGFDFWVVKLDSAGVIAWQKTIGGSDWDELYFMDYGSNGPILGGYSRSGITGEKTEASLGLFDFWIIRLFQSPVVGIDQVLFSALPLRVYPNPAHDILVVEAIGFPLHGSRLIITDPAGKTVLEAPLQATGSHLDVSGLSRGLYFVQLVNSGYGRVSSRFVKN